MRGKTILGMALLVLGLACGSDGGDGGSPVGPPSGISFQPSSVPGTNSLALGTEAGSTTQLLRLELRAQNMTNVYGLSFDLLYPSQLLSFTASTEGSFLGGTQTTMQVEERTPGRLVVGISRLGNVPGANGSGVVMTLEFMSQSVAGNGAIQFQSNTAFAANGAPIGGVAWGGGTVTVAP